MFRLPFFSFSFLFAAVIDLLLGLLAVKKLLRKHHRDPSRCQSCAKEKSSGVENASRRAIFSMEQPGVVAGNFALSFSLNFLSIFARI